MNTIHVTGGLSSSALPARTVVADDYIAIRSRYVGQPVEYVTSDGVTVPGVVVEIQGLSMFVDVSPAHLPDSALDPAPEGWEDYALVCDAMDLECPGCEDDADAPHWRSCPRWDNPRNAGF